MDPTSVALVGSAFGGAIITAVIGLVTHALTGHQEHRRWLLDLKYQAYLKIVVSMEQGLQAVNDPEQVPQLMDKWYKALEEFNGAEMSMVSSESAMDAFKKLVTVYAQYAPHVLEDRETQWPYRDAVNDAYDICVREFRKDLKIRT